MINKWVEDVTPTTYGFIDKTIGSQKCHLFDKCKTSNNCFSFVIPFTMDHFLLSIIGVVVDDVVLLPNHFSNRRKNARAVSSYIWMFKSHSAISILAMMLWHFLLFSSHLGIVYIFTSWANKHKYLYIELMNARMDQLKDRWTKRTSNINGMIGEIGHMLHCSKMHARLTEISVHTHANRQRPSERLNSYIELIENMLHHHPCSLISECLHWRQSNGIEPITCEQKINPS